MYVEKKDHYYQPIADLLGKTNQACRLKIHHIKKDVDLELISLEDALAGKPLPSQQCNRRKQATAKAKTPLRSPSLERKRITPPPARNIAVKLQRVKREVKKRSISPEDTLAKKPVLSKTPALRKQDLVEKINIYRSQEGTRSSVDLDLRDFSKEDAAAVLVGLRLMSAVRDARDKSIRPQEDLLRYNVED